MKVRTTVLLAAATLLIPMGASLFSPDMASARGMRGNRGTGNGTEVIAMRGDKDLTPEQREAKMAEREAKMKAELGLSDAQAAQIKAIRESHKSEFEALHAKGKALKDSGADREAMKPIHDEMKALHEKVKGEIAQVLTAEQQAKLETLKKDHGGRGGPEGDRQGRRGNRGAATTPAQ
jgi:Spy/CpxP family protein refolding chaperone